MTSLLTFFFDRSIGKSVPQALIHLKPPFDVKWHQGEKFSKDMPDDEWMSIIGPKKWIVVGQDWHYHMRPNELLAIKQHGIKCFYLPGSGDTKWKTFCRFARAHQRLLETASKVQAPFVFDLKSNGRLQVVPI